MRRDGIRLMMMMMIGLMKHGFISSWELEGHIAENHICIMRMRMQMWM